MRGTRKERLEMVTLFSHHVRWGAARHPGGSPGPRRRHTEGGHHCFRSSPPWSLENPSGSWSVLAGGSRVSAGAEGVETCSGASSSLLHNHFGDCSPELTDKFQSNVRVCAKGTTCRPERPPRPSDRQQDPGREKVDRAEHCWHIRTRSSPVWVGKERIISAVARLM